VSAPLGVAAAVTGVDAVRKRRTTEVHEAPEDPPHSAEVAGNALTTYTYGAHLYDDMIEAIEQATDHIYLATFIWKGDDLGQRFKDALVAAADRGVTVCVVFDGFANLVVPRAFKTFPPSVHVMKFPALRPGLALVDVRRTGRDHRKVLVVDDVIGFVGGYNIGELYATQWRDTHLRVEGEAVWELCNTFVDFWNRHRRAGLPMLPDSGAPGWDHTIRAARNEPSRVVFPVRGIYLEAIDRATHHIWITQAYFIPDREILHGLLSRRRRGGPQLLRRPVARRRAHLPLPRRHGARQDRNGRRGLDHRGHGQHRPAVPARQLRGQPGDPGPHPGAGDGGHLPPRPRQLCRAVAGGVAGPRPAAPGGRAGAAAVAAPAVTASLALGLTEC
jgi:hypothetical protein